MKKQRSNKTKKPIKKPDKKAAENQSKKGDPGKSKKTKVREMSGSFQKNSQKVGNKNPPKHSQFKPGISGNLKGGPRGKTVKTFLKEAIDENIDFLNPITMEKNNMPIAKALAFELIAKGFGGGKDSLAAINSILDRIDGKARQHIEMDGQLEIPEKRQSKEDLIKRLNSLAAQSKQKAKD